MTVMTKPSITVKKYPLITEGPMHMELAAVEMQIPKGNRGVGTVMCMVVSLFLLILMGVITAMQIYLQLTSDFTPPGRYQGFCSIPISRDLQIMESRKMPLRWKTSPNVDLDELNIQVVSLMDEDPEHLFDLLREVLDIDIDQSVEKISVFNNGHPVSFIHDFESNLTGIVDEERCYTMELDTSAVLAPDALLSGMQRGAEFDVARATSQLRARLPPVTLHHHQLPAGFTKCADKPVYQLEKDTAVVIRKRSADAPPHDYIQFAGKHIQEIDITNLADVLQYEQEQVNKPKA